jgi:hypothetical protein
MEIFQAAVPSVLNAVQETYARDARENPGDLDVDGNTPNVHPLKSSRR